MRPHARRRLPSRPSRAGFSLIEMMVTLVLLAVVVAVIATVMIGSQRSKAVTEGRLLYADRTLRASRRLPA